LLGQERKEKPIGEAEMKDPVGVLALLLIFGPLFVAVVGGVFIKALRIWKGISPEQSQQLRAEEAKLMQELYQGLSQMEERVQALETLLLDRQRKEGSQ
jgi:phage shock protein B